jgi:F0F1-type ATP synthase membrane subunit b/b'
MTKKEAVFLLALLPFLLFMTEETGGHESGGSGMLGKVVNFTLLAGALVFLLRKPLQSALAGRTTAVRASLEEARQARASAEAKLDAARGQVVALESEVALIRSRAETEAAAERDRIRATAAAEAARIRTLAGQDVEAQLKAGIRELKAFTADLAAGLAEERLKRRMTDELHSALIDRSIERLGTLHEESGSR